MNLVRAKELAVRFRVDAVPSRERFQYLLFLQLFTSVLSSSVFVKYSYDAGDEITLYDLVSDLIFAMITVVGIYLCYRTNKAGDDKDFVERFIGLSIPVLVQTLILMLLLIAAVVSWDLISPENAALDTLGSEAIVALLVIFFYWRLNSALTIASAGELVEGSPARE